MHADGFVPMCKDCIQNNSFNNETNDIDIESFKTILRQIDKPYIETIFQSSINQYNATYEGKNVPLDNRKIIIAYYFKNINTLRQYRTLDWNQGIEWEKRIMKLSKNSKPSKIEDKYTSKSVDGDTNISNDTEEEKVYTLGDDDSFKVTDDIIRLFGGGYHKSDYKAMWDKYDFLSKNYPDLTNLHTEALVTYVRFKVKEEQATAQGDSINAEKWNNAATKAAEKAKINPNQLSQSDLQGGLNSFSELSLMVEQAVDIIPILPRFKFRPNDAIDFNVW